MYKPKITLNKEVIENTVKQVMKNDTLKQIQEAALEYFVFQTKQKKRNLKALEDLRKQVKKTKIILESQENKIQTYFQAYELILDIRKFFLGNLGEIDYNILVSTKKRGGNAEIKTITISHELFRNLILNQNKELIGLINSGGNLRFNKVLVNSLKNILFLLEKQGVDITILNNQKSFRITNEIVGKSKDFKNSNLFKAAIDNAKNRSGERYIFNIDAKMGTKKGQPVFSYYIQAVEGRPMSSSIFSAIGKYSADEILAKKEQVRKMYSLDVVPFEPNTGNLSEIYELAKSKLNNNKNDFEKRRPVPGKDLYKIFAEVLRNTDPFYMGGDILTEQIKSFLGSCPSLTSFSTLRLSIERFDEALSQQNFDELKEKLKKLLIKNQENLLEAENSFAQELIQTLENFKLQE